MGNTKVDALAAVDNAILKALSDSKSETRAAAKRAHDTYAEVSGEPRGLYSEQICPHYTEYALVLGALYVVL